MQRDQILILLAAFFRAVGVGLMGVLFALYLAQGKLNTVAIGVLLALGIAGLSCGTLWISFCADRFGRKPTLLYLSGLTCLGGLGLAWFPSFPLLCLICFVGMVNAMGRERGAMFTLEQATLPQMVAPEQRTQVLAWYNLVLDMGMAVGSLAGFVPVLFQNQLGLTGWQAYQWTMVLYAGLSLLSACCYAALSAKIEVAEPVHWKDVSDQTRKKVKKFSLLSGLDSFAGGFIPSALIAYWFFERFGASEGLLGTLFFVGHIINAFSYLAAVWLSKKIGLVKTMVFTHIPSQLLLIAVPFVPTLNWALLLYLIREFFVEMDVPTRESYLMGVVQPGERTFASGVTNLTRVLCWVPGPSLAGVAMRHLSMHFPLIFGPAVKIVYDVMLYQAFKKHRPPEERD